MKLDRYRIDPGDREAFKRIDPDAKDLSDKEIMTKAATDANADPKKLVEDGVAKANAILKENAPKR